MSRIVGRALVLGGVLLFAGFVLLAHGCARFLGGGGHVFGAEVTEGRIVAIRGVQQYSGQRRKGMVYESTVEFEAGGRTVRIEDKTGFVATGRREGSTVSVHYRPEAPERALINGTAPFSVTIYLFELVAGWLVVIITALAMILAVVRSKPQ